MLQLMQNRAVGFLYLYFFVKNVPKIYLQESSFKKNQAIYTKVLNQFKQIFKVILLQNF